MPKIAIVAALEREVHRLIRRWTTRDHSHSGRNFRFFEHGEAVLVCGGIGPTAARRATEAVIALYAPATVFSVGFAGALVPEMHIADILVPRRVIDAADGSSVDTAIGEGTLVTFNAIASPEQKSRLRDSFTAHAVDMEAAAVARAASARGIRFAAVKAISDLSTFTFPALENFISPDGSFRAGKFGLYVIPRPWLWPSLRQLARNSARASHALCDWIQSTNLAKIAQTESQPAASLEAASHS
jgi:nucleoside phosphorylase